MFWIFEVASESRMRECIEVQSHKASLNAPERQFADFGALRTLFDLGWDCTLGVKDGDLLPGKTAKKLVIGLVPVCRQSTQFFEFGLWYLDNDVKTDIWLTRAGKVASGVNVGGWHIQQAKLCDWHRRFLRKRV